MKRLTSLVFLLVLCGMMTEVWAGPAEEVAEIALRRAQGFREGNLDVFMADWADKGVLTSALAGFRFEGKEAVRAHFAALFEQYPQRQTVGRHAVSRAFANDTVVVTNGYSDLTLVDRSGHVSRFRLRTSVIWVKLDRRWQIVDQHNSVLPASP